MKKISRKFQYPLMASMILPSMLIGMSGIMAYRNLAAGADFFSAWGESIMQVVPPALLLLMVIAPTVRLFVTKVLLQPEDA
jgi:hypothetical protein